MNKTIIDNKQYTLAIEILALSNQLPSASLKQFITTIDLACEWRKNQKSANLLGHCLKARFGGGGGNPAKDAMKKGIIDELGYEIFENWTKIYQSLFTVYQLSWNDIWEVFKNIDDINNDRPTSEQQLFLTTIRDDRNNSFYSAVTGRDISIKTLEACCKQIVQSNIKYQCSEESIFLNVIELSKYEKILPKFHLQNTWTDLAWFICHDVANTDTNIKKALKIYWNNVTALAQLMKSACEKEGQNKPIGRVGGESWKNGRKNYIGNRNKRTPMVTIEYS